VILISQYSDLLAGGDIPIQKGDEIVVRPNVKSFLVMGAVGRRAVTSSKGRGAASTEPDAASTSPEAEAKKASNIIELTKSNMTLAEALGEVYGLNDLRANKTGVFIFRLGDFQKNPEARPRVFRLDLLQPVSVFVAQQFTIQPRDVVYVTNAPLYEYNKILTAVYGTISIVGISKGTTIPASSF
jgi:polysaccharide export outer membrane protein